MMKSCGSEDACHFVVYPDRYGVAEAAASPKGSHQLPSKLVSSCVESVINLVVLLRAAVSRHWTSPAWGTWGAFNRPIKLS